MLLRNRWSIHIGQRGREKENGESVSRGVHGMKKTKIQEQLSLLGLKRYWVEVSPAES